MVGRHASAHAAGAWRTFLGSIPQAVSFRHRPEFIFQVGNGRHIATLLRGFAVPDAPLVLVRGKVNLT
jgi:hypothetical protein